MFPSMNVKQLRGIPLFKDDFKFENILIDKRRSITNWKAFCLGKTLNKKR